MPDASIAVASGQAAAAAPVTPVASNSKSQLQSMSDQFLTLLVAQMKNQDPLNPADNSQITSQIAQINTVSGINDLNSTLSSITGQIQTGQNLQASSLIGKQVLVAGDSIKVGSDGTATPFGVNLDQPAAKMTVTIADNTGKVVYQTSYTNQAAGAQSFVWDGHDANGAAVPAGSYHVSIQAKDGSGSAVAATALATGYVSGVVTNGTEPRLDLGPEGLVGLDGVYQIL